jgi:hypothetical protein
VNGHLSLTGVLAVTFVTADMARLLKEHLAFAPSFVGEIPNDDHVAEITITSNTITSDNKPQQVSITSRGCQYGAWYKPRQFPSPVSSHNNTDRMQLITLALVTGPHLYQRVSLIQSIQDNAPGKLQSRSAFSSYEVKFADRIRNCEDVILLDGLDGVALLSCDEARDRWNTVMVRIVSSFVAPATSHCPISF